MMIDFDMEAFDREMHETISQLEHHGVKGMKWGERRAAKKSAKADAKWQKNVYSIHGAIAVHNHVADKMNNGVLDKLNNNPKYKGKQLLHPQTGEPVGSTGKQYLHDYNQLVAHHTAEAVKTIHGTSPSGKYKARLDTSNKNQWAVRVTPNAQHGIDGIDALKPSPMANPREPELLMEVNNHPITGHLATHKKIQIPVAHSDEVVENVLEHFGVRGMRWGQRKAGKSSGRTSSDRKKSDVILEKHKSGGTKALTNHEITQLNKRLQMEQQLHTLLPKKKSKLASGQKFAKSMLGVEATVTGLYAFSKTPMGKAVVNAIKNTVTKQPSGKHFAK